MIPAMFAMWAMAAPMGYLAGIAFCNVMKIKSGAEYVPWLGAVLTPMGMVMALMVVVSDEVSQDGESE